MFTSTRRAIALAATVVLLGLAACSGGDQDEGAGGDSSGGDNKIVVWTGDTIPDRVDKTKKIIAGIMKRRLPRTSSSPASPPRPASRSSSSGWTRTSSTSC